MANGTFGHLYEKMIKKLIFLLLAFLFLLNQAYALTFKVTISNPNSYDLQDYQVRIDLSSYLSQPTNLIVCTDINDCVNTQIPFCCEQSNGECNTNPSNVIWVKVNLTANSNTTIYIVESDTNYAKNGGEVFDFYDDFNDGIVDWSHNTRNGASYVVEEVAGHLHIKETADGSGGWDVQVWKENVVSYSDKFTIETKMKANLNQQYHYAGLIIPGSDYVYNGDNYGNEFIGFVGQPYNRFNLVYRDTAGNEHVIIDTGISYENVYNWFISVSYSNGVIKGYIKNLDTGQEWNGQTSYNFGWKKGIVFMTEFTDNELWIDWIRVRKYADQEPHITIQMIEISITLLSPENKTYYTSKINVSFSVNSNIDSQAWVKLYIDGNLTLDENVTLPYTYHVLTEFLKERSHNVTVWAKGLTSDVEVTETVTFSLDLYDENITYSNYTLYDNTKYVDTLVYQISVRCGALGYNITVLANFTDANKTYTIVCDNSTKIIEDSFRFSSEGQKEVWFKLNAVNESDNKYFGNESFVADLYPPQTIKITLPDYITLQRNNKTIATNFSLYVYDTISPILECKILRKLTDVNDNNYVIANNLTDIIQNNSTKTYFYLFSDTNINYYEDYIEVECKDLVNHTKFSNLTKEFIRQDFDFIDELLKTKSDYNRTYAIYCIDGSTLLKQTETQTADSITIITYPNCTWFSISTEYNNVILIQDFELSLTSKYYDNIEVCVPSSNQQYVVKHLVASEPYPEYLITIFNPDSGCFVASSNLKYYSQNVYYLPIPTILNQKYAISVQNVYVASVTGSETPVDVSLLIQKLIQLQDIAKKLLLTFEYNITHEITDTAVRVYIKAQRTIKDIYVEIWRANQKLGVLTIKDVNNNTAVISILKSQYDNFALNETKKEYLRISITFEDGFSINIIYPKSPYGYSIPTILVWVISILFVLYFFAVRGYYIKTIYASISLITLSIFISLISESYAPIVFASALLLAYLFDVIYKVFIPEEIRKDIVIQMAIPLVKITLASIFTSAIISSLNIPANLPFSSDIDVIRQNVEKISLQIENMLSSPLQTILTIVNVVLTAFVLLWYSIKLTMSLIMYILNVVVGGILPISAIATAISIIIIMIFIIGIIRALILARTQ